MRVMGILFLAVREWIYAHGEVGLGMNAGVFSVGESPGAAVTKYPRWEASTTKRILPQPWGPDV